MKEMYVIQVSVNAVRVNISNFSHILSTKQVTKLNSLLRLSFPLSANKCSYTIFLTQSVPSNKHKHGIILLFSSHTLIPTSEVLAAMQRLWGLLFLQSCSYNPVSPVYVFTISYFLFSHPLHFSSYSFFYCVMLYNVCCSYSFSQNACQRYRIQFQILLCMYWGWVRSLGLAYEYASQGKIHSQGMQH